MILITGGAGFIGSNFILSWFKHSNEDIINVDKLTYAANLNYLSSLKNDLRYRLIIADINDLNLLKDILFHYKPRAIIHFAAESFVDKSIHQPDIFIKTNIQGTFNLLKSALAYWSTLKTHEKEKFRYIQISTDEVYGSLNSDEAAFTEAHAYKPNNPYSASKAAADHLVRSFNHTYGLPTLITISSNNYGPFQFPEKLIPLMISNSLQNKNLSIYGKGKNIRDWLYVEDNCSAILQVLSKGTLGSTYNIGASQEKTNLEVVQTICSILDKLRPKAKSYKELIHFVSDRMSNDFRYAINANKIKKELSWQPSVNFNEGLLKTVKWYLKNLPL